MGPLGGQALRASGGQALRALGGQRFALRLGAAQSIVLTAAVVGSSTPIFAQSTFPADSVVQALLDERVRDGRSVGLALALIEPDGSTRFLSAGDAGPARNIDRESVFEIGSITKVFTAVLLAEMVRRGEVSFDDPVAKYLPATVTMPSRDGSQITLGQLSTQTSGLPRLPANMRPGDPLNPYADYSVEQLYEFLSGHTLTRAPGAQFEYSNLGVGLLGHALALRAGMSYEALVKERVLLPLGMRHTAITLSPALQARAVAAHDASGDTVPYWDLPTLAGAGALRSTAADMIRFAEAALRGSGSLHESLRTTMQPRAPAGANATIGLGWIRTVAASDTVVWHNGGTGGFRSFLGVAPSSGRAVVLLTNSGGVGADDIGMHLLNPALPLAPPARQAVEVPAHILERYVGTYELAPQFSIVVTLANDVLRGQPTNQPAIRLWPESATKFFIREVDAQITFEVAADGTVTGLVLHQNSRDMPGRRIR
ncbi:serine hydrolase [soil metagenome]